MQVLRIIIVSILIFIGIYTISMNFIDESKTFVVEKTVNYPVDKVFTQFNNLQNYTNWEESFSPENNLTVVYFKPYEGIGSSLEFHNQKKNETGELYIRYCNPNQKTIKYQLFQGNNQYPYEIKVKFKPILQTQTKITWLVKTPRLSFFKRAKNLFTKNTFTKNIDESIDNLNNLLGSKIDKENIINSIKYDSLIVENQKEEILLGINVTTSNKKADLYNNIILNHNKVYSYLTTDLQKEDDEIGFPTKITDADNFYDKEVSYFYGFPVAKKIGITDNNFSFVTQNPSNNYVMYYKGYYNNRINIIKTLISKAKKDSMRNGKLKETFLTTPEKDQEVIIKFSLPVYK